MRIPFGFVTGYGHSLAERHAHVPLLQKPFTAYQLRALLEKLVGPAGHRTTRPTRLDDHLVLGAEIELGKD
jgi:hypothetical protein